MGSRNLIFTPSAICSGAMSPRRFKRSRDNVILRPRIIPQHPATVPIPAPKAPLTARGAFNLNRVVRALHGERVYGTIKSDQE